MSEPSRGLPRLSSCVGLPLLAAAAIASRVPCQATGTGVASADSPSAQHGSANAKVTAYDVVTVKPSNSTSDSTSVWTNADSFTARGVSLNGLISFGYGVRADQISGVPAWAESARFDVTAKIVDADTADLRKMSSEERRPLVQALLADRFRLKTHTESKTMLVYELVISPGGPKMKEVAAGDKETTFNGVSSGGTSIRNGHLVAHDISVAQLIASLSNELQRTIIDKTGLRGTYDFQLVWSRENSSADSSDSAAPPLFSALREQLGLKLQSTKGPVKIVVVDHVDKPMEN